MLNLVVRRETGRLLKVKRSFPFHEEGVKIVVQRLAAFFYIRNVRDSKVRQETDCIDEAVVFFL
jgi:hypothetical protein